MLLLFTFFFLGSISLGCCDNCSAHRFSFNLTPHFSRLNLSGHLEGVAILVSPEFSPTLPIVVINAMTHLPPWWHLIVLTQEDKWFSDKKSALFETVSLLRIPETKTNRKHGRIKNAPLLKNFLRSVRNFDGKEFRYFPYARTFLHVLPSPAAFTNLMVYNCALLSASLYEDIPTEKMLIMQPDSLLLHKDGDESQRPPNRTHYFLRDFFQYGFVGAPWKNSPCAAVNLQHGGADDCLGGGNGGLSFRLRSLLLKALSPPAYQYFYTSNGAVIHEDNGITRRLADISPSSLAPLSVRLQFSSETLFSPDPYGLHKPWNSLSEAMMKNLEQKYIDLSILRHVTAGRFRSKSDEILAWLQLNLPPFQASSLWETYLVIASHYVHRRRVHSRISHRSDHVG